MLYIMMALTVEIWHMSKFYNELELGQRVNIFLSRKNTGAQPKFHKNKRKQTI